MTLAVRTITSITPCLWFDDRLEEAARFYTRIFPNSALGPLARDADGVATAGEFTLDGTRFRGVNGGPGGAGFSPAVSFAITCRDQSEVDYFWHSLVDGGAESACGWLTDRFGLSWHVVPTRLDELLRDPVPSRAAAVAHAMLGMRRLVVRDLEAAADAASPLHPPVPSPSTRPRRTP